MNKNKLPFFFYDKPIFGMDIGHTSLKVMQSSFGDPSNKSKKPSVIGYGATSFDPTALKDGVIVQPKVIAEAALKMFSENLVGDITTNRCVIAIPAYRIFTRYIKLPKLKDNEIEDAAKLEVEQYIPMPLEELYMDYAVVKNTKDLTDIFFVAVPKTIIDSYLDLSYIIGTDPLLIEPTLSSSGRLFSFDKNNNIPSLIIDFGSQSSDMSIFYNTIIATGTVNSGGDTFTDRIAKTLNISLAEAKIVKNKYGLGVSKKQKEINESLEPVLSTIVKEIERMIRYYEEQDAAKDSSIKQIVTLGGGANMPGLNDYLTSHLRLPVRHTDPWQYFNFNRLPVPSEADKPMYATVAGLSIIRPKEIFRYA